MRVRRQHFQLVGNESAPIWTNFDPNINRWHLYSGIRLPVVRPMIQRSSLGWPLPVLEYKHIFQIKYTEAVLSNSTPKPLWFEITKMLTAALKNKFIVLFIITFGTLSFPIRCILRRLA